MHQVSPVYQVNTVYQVSPVYNVSNVYQVSPMYQVSQCDQDFHYLLMYSTVTSVPLGTQLKMPICLPGFLDHCRNGPLQMLMFI